MIEPAPGPVLDHEGLLERFAEMLREHARIDVGRAAGAERHDDLHRARRIILRLRGIRRGKHEQSSGNPEHVPV